VLNYSYCGNEQYLKSYDNKSNMLTGRDFYPSHPKPTRPPGMSLSSAK